MLHILDSSEEKKFEIKIFRHAPDKDKSFDTIRAETFHIKATRIILEGESLIFYNEAQLMLIAPSSLTRVLKVHDY